MMESKALYSKYLKIAAIMALLLMVLPAAPHQAAASSPLDSSDAELFALDAVFCAGGEVHPIAESIAETFGVPYDQLMDYYCQGVSFEDILLALETASESNITVDEVIAAHQQQQTWQQIWDTYKTLLVGCGTSVEETTASNLAERYQATYADVMSLYCQGLAFAQIEQAYSEVNFDSPLANHLLPVTSRVYTARLLAATVTSLPVNPGAANRQGEIRRVSLQDENLENHQDWDNTPEILFKELIVSMKSTGLIGLPPPLSL